MSRLAIGVKGFDTMVQGGLPVGSSVILQGPPGQEKLRFALTFLAEGLRAGASGLVVTASQSPDAVLAELRNLGVNLDQVATENRLRIVDWYSWSEETVQDVEERGAVIRSSIDLTNLGVALSRAIASLKGDQARRAVIELLSPATNVYELTQVYAFAQSAKRKFDRYQFTSLVLLEKEMHSAPELTTLHQPFDGVIEIERTRSGDRIVRKVGVLHLKGTSPDPTFRELEFSDKGMRVVSEKPKAAAKLTSIPGTTLESQEERARRLQLIMQIASERLKLNPRDADALFAMAAAQATLDDVRGGLESLERLAELIPDYPGLWVLKTKLHARLGEADRARQSRLRAQQTQAETPRATVPCPMCEAPVAEDASTCANCGVKFQPATKLEDELDELGQAAIQEMVEDELGIESRPEPERTKPSTKSVPQPQPEVPPQSRPPSKPTPKKGLTNGLVLGRRGERRPGMTNGLRGRTNGLRGRTNGLTNGLGRTNGLTNGLGRTNGLTNGIGRTNGLTNGLGRTNGLTNGLGRTNGLTNGLGRTNGITNGLGRTNGLTNGLGGIRPTGFHSAGLRGMMRNAGWKLYLIPLVTVVLLLMPLFFVPEYRGPAYPIQIDGQFGDWASVSTEAMAPGVGLNPNIDVVRFGVVDNLGPLAFYVEVAGAALMGGGPSPGTMDAVRIFVDIDGSGATGYRVDGFGADRLIDVSGYGGSVLASTLWEFDSNRDPRDWNGWIKGTGTAAAASASRIEVQAEWLTPGATSPPPIVGVHTSSWDGHADSGDFPISPAAGTLSVVADPVLPEVLSGSGIPLLRLTLTAHGQAIPLGSLRVEIAGTAPPSSALSLRLMDGSTVLASATPTSRDVTFSFPTVSIGVGAGTTLTVVGDFSATTGETFGVGLPSSHPFGLGASVVSLQENPGLRTAGYLGIVPPTPGVDGAFAEWSSASFPDAANDVAPRANADIDLRRYGAVLDGGSTFLYTDVQGRIFRGTSVPESPREVPEQVPSPPADTDRDGVPNSLDPMPLDFDNDGTPDSQTNGDYDGDAILDYGFSGGTDYWLNTTLPGSFPAPYAGRFVSVFIGPTESPPALGEDVLRFFLDVDNVTLSGYAIGGIGADRLVEVRGKDGRVTGAALLSFSGSFPGQWSWAPMVPVTVARGHHEVELSVPALAASVVVDAGDFWGSVDTTAAGPASMPQASSFRVSAANLPLSVPWAQVGPEPAATPIDGGSNAATTMYNHQRKVVRAGDVPGDTACDATNSDGCWYAVFQDQLAEETSTTTPRAPNVQNGATSLGASSSSVNVTITSVTTSKSFLVFNIRHNLSAPSDATVSGNLTSSTNLRFNRTGTSGVVSIEWYVAEFPSGVSVQRGAMKLDGVGNDQNVAIASVDVTKAFPIVSYREVGAAHNCDDFIRATITSATNLQLSACAPDSWVEWQVVEYASSSVQTNAVTFLSGDGSKTATLGSPVNVGKSWLLFTFNVTGGTDANIGQKMVRGNLTDSTTLTFNRDQTGARIDLRWYLVQFTDDTTTRRGTASFGTAETQKDATLSPGITTSRTIAFTGSINPAGGGKTPYSTDDNPGTALATLDLTSTTNLRLTRGVTGSQTADVGWFVVEFGTVATGSLVAGTFPTDVQTSNDVYAQYQEANPTVDHSFVEVTTRQTTTSDTYVDIPGASIASTSFTPGRKYLLVFTAQVDSLLSANRNAFIQTVHGSTVFPGSEFSFRTDDTAVRYGYYWFTVWTAASGESVKLQFHIEGTTVLVGADQITMFKLDLGDLTENTDWFFNENTAGDTISGTGWDGLASITFTPSQASDWLVMTTMRGDPDSISVNYESRIARSGEVVETQPLTTWEGNDNALDRYVQTLSRVYSLTSASNTFTQESRCSGTCTYPRTYSSAFALNLNKFEDRTSAWTEAPVALSTTNFATQVQTASLTPTRTADVWIVGQFAVDVDSTGNFHRFRLQVDNVDQPGTQTSDAYGQWENWDSADEVLSAIQTVENLDVAAHTFDLDASREGTTANAEDRVIFAVSMVLAGAEMEVRYDWSGIAAGASANVLKVEAYHAAGEDFLLQVLSPPSTWNTRLTITKTADDNLAQTYALTTAEFNSGAPSIRFVDANGPDGSLTSLWIDFAAVVTVDYWDRIVLMRSSDTSGSTWGSQIVLASGRSGDAPLLYSYESAEPSIAMDSGGFLHLVWVSASSTGNQNTFDRVRYTKTTVAYPSQAELSNAPNWVSVAVLDDASPGFMPTISTDSSQGPHIAWSGSKTSGTAYYKNKGQTETWYARTGDQTGVSTCGGFNKQLSGTAGSSASTQTVDEGVLYCFYTPARTLTLEAGTWTANVELRTSSGGPAITATITIAITSDTGSVLETIASCSTGSNPDVEETCTATGVGQKVLDADRIRVSVTRVGGGGRVMTLRYNGAVGGDADTRTTIASDWSPTVSWGTAYTGLSVDVSPGNDYVHLARYYEAATNEVQYLVCKDLSTSRCNSAAEFTRWNGTAGYDTVATSVESGTYPSLAATYGTQGDVWVAYAKDVDGSTRAIYSRFLDYPSNGFSIAETVDSLSGTLFTRPTIGLDKDGNVHALYATTGGQLYYKMRTGVWGSRVSVDAADYPSIVVRGPNDTLYPETGALYWKPSTGETYFFIPEFDMIVLPIAGILLAALLRRRRAGRTALRLGSEA